MRLARILLIVAALAAPVSVFALEAPFVGSPFAHMTVPLFEDASLPNPSAQEAAVAAALPAGTKAEKCAGESEEHGDVNKCFKGNTNICEDENITIVGSEIVDKFKCLCKTDDDVKKAGCGQGQIHGSVTFMIGETAKTVSKCDKSAQSSLQQLQKSCSAVPGGKCVPVGDSNAAKLANPKFPNACNGGGAFATDNQCNVDNLGTQRSDPTHPSCYGRTADDTLKMLDNLPKGTLSGTVPVSEGTNDLQTLEQCKNDPSNCKLDKIYQAVKDNADNPNDVQLKCLGILSDPSYNQTIKDACERNGGQFVDLPGKAGNWHSNDAGYQQVLKDIGQFENPGTAPGGDFGGGGNEQGNESKALPTKCGIEGISGNIMYAESGCGAQNSNPKSSVSGPYHFLCSTWNTYASRCNAQYIDDSSCSNGYRDDNIISTRVMDCMNSNFTQTYGDRCTQAGVSANACLYAIHVNGEPTFKNMLSALESDPNQSAGSLCGSIIRSDGCSNNFTQSMRSGSLQNLFAEYDKRLGGSGSFVPPVAVAQRGGDYGGGSDTFSTTQLESHPSISSGNSFGSNNMMQQMMQMMMLQNLMATMQQRQQALQQAAQQQAQSHTQQQAVQPTATLTVQPQVATRGNPFSVSWTSSGMSTNAPCIVTKNGNTIGQGNTGSIAVPTSATSTATSIIFRLVCQAAGNGQIYQQSSTALLQ
jgi:hypothetical protein